MVNLVPIQGNDSQTGCTYDAVENIDIGGPSMLRSAAKNHVVVDPADYAVVFGRIGSQRRNKLRNSPTFTAKVFRHTAAHDALTASFSPLKWVKT